MSIPASARLAANYLHRLEHLKKFELAANEKLKMIG